MSAEFQSKSEVDLTVNFLPLTDDVMVESQHKCLQQPHLLALHLLVLGYIPRLLYGLTYFLRIGDFNGESLIFRLLRNKFVLAAPKRFTEEAEKSFIGVILTEGNIVLKLVVEEGICTEDAECNLRGESLILAHFVLILLINDAIEIIPLHAKRH